MESHSVYPLCVFHIKYHVKESAESDVGGTSFPVSRILAHEDALMKHLEGKSPELIQEHLSLLCLGLLRGTLGFGELAV